jgi:hypothetical protein
MSMGGGSPTQTTTGSGQGYGYGTSGGWSIGNTSGASSGATESTPVLFNWKDILPPWVSSNEEKLIPYLMSRARTGMTPQEEQTLWGGVKDTLESGNQDTSKNFMRQVIMNGLSPNSPAVAGGLSDLATDRMSQGAKASLDFAKLKMGARDTALGQLMSALYNPAGSPYAIGQKSTGSNVSESAGANASSNVSQNTSENWNNSVGSSSTGGGK